jgi:hypothetical protein
MNKEIWSWQERARCRTIDLASVPLIDTVIEADDESQIEVFIPEILNHITDVFYVEDWEEEKVERAKGYCEACPVRAECLDFAIGMREREGIWGGTTGNERRSLLNKMRKAGEEIPKYSTPMPRGVGVD